MTTDGREIRRHVDNLHSWYQTQSANIEHKNFDWMDPLIIPDFPEPVVDTTSQSSPVVTESRGRQHSNQGRHPPDYYSKYKIWGGGEGGDEVTLLNGKRTSSVI